jgi:hypothetical protein
MSITKQVTIWCDREGCGSFMQIDESRIARARKEAWHEGWAQIGPSDYCPTDARLENPTKGTTA